MLLGLIGVWNQNFMGTTSHAILPYTQRLHRLPAFLQQLEMESNGKSVTRDGRPVSWSTGTVIWGEPGSNAQHAFFQLLHQGTAAFAADFIAPARASGGPASQHLAGLANMLAQAEAFARGRTEERGPARSCRRPASRKRRRGRLAPHKVHPGQSSEQHDSPRCTRSAAVSARSIALYEHKVFVQSVIWGINPFDQWGVELGKVLAQDMQRRSCRRSRAPDRCRASPAEILAAQGS